MYTKVIDVLMQLRLSSTMPAQFEHGERCDGSNIWASVDIIPKQFENGGKIRNLD